MASVTKMSRADGKERPVQSGEKPEVVFYQVRWKNPARQTRKKNFQLRRDADAYAATVETAKSSDPTSTPHSGASTWRHGGRGTTPRSSGGPRRWRGTARS